MDIQKDFEDKYFGSKYGKIHYVHHNGAGTAIVFLHGFAGSLRSWTRLFQHLPQDFNIYALDLLGHGASDAPDIDYTLRNHYEGVKELIDSEKLSGYYIFGHSYGGWIAAYYAIQENIRGIILEDAAGLTEFVEDRHAENPKYREEMVHKALALNPREKVLRSMLNSDNYDAMLTPGNLGAIESRTLIIWGRDDMTVKFRYSEIFKNAIPGSRLVVFENDKHTPHYTNPEGVAKLLVEFVEKR